MNTNGYKICYREQGTTEYVRWFITRTYRKAKHVLRGCFRFPPTERASNRPLVNPHWKIIPITNKEIKAGIWREIPF